MYNGDPLRAPGYECIVKKNGKLRVCTYISLKVLSVISFVICQREDDVLNLKIFPKEGKLVGQSRSFGLITVYNRQTLDGNSVQSDKLFIETSELTLVVGDLNIHTSLTDPERIQASGERRNGEVYMRTAALNVYTILNTPGIYTRFPDNPIIHRPSVLDYLIANASMLAKVSRWRDITQRTGSDHIIIVIEIDSEEVEVTRPGPDWEKIKWRNDKGEPNPEIEAQLKDYWNKEWRHVEIHHASERECNFQISLRRLIHLVKSWVPMKRPTRWSKGWWTPELTELRRV